jgi:hypothetical protein
MKGVLVVVVMVVMHPPTFPSTEGSQITVAVFRPTGTYGRKPRIAPSSAYAGDSRGALSE